jgi:hypothetical protein
MQRSATLAGPGIARSPSAHFRTVRSSTSSAIAASRWFMPSAAIASRNCSGDTADNALRVNRHASRRQSRAQRLNRFVNAERVGQAAVSLEQRQALRPVVTASDEADCIGGKGGAGCGLEHTHNLGPLALSVKGYFYA